MKAFSRRAILSFWALILLSAVIFLLVPALIHGGDAHAALLSEELIDPSQQILAGEELVIVSPASEQGPQGKRVVPDKVVQVRPAEGGVDHGHTGTSDRSYSRRG